MELDIEALRSKGKSQPITFIGHDHNTTGEAIVEELGEGARLWRSVRTGLLWLFITAFAVCIPILHFVLVPISLVVTCIVTVTAFGTKRVVLGGVGKCPYCDKDFHIFKRPYKFPILDVCEYCGRQVQIELAEPAPEQLSAS